MSHSAARTPGCNSHMCGANGAGTPAACRSVVHAQDASLFEMNKKYTPPPPPRRRRHRQHGSMKKTRPPPPVAAMPPFRTAERSALLASCLSTARALACWHDAFQRRTVVRCRSAYHHLAVLYKRVLAIAASGEQAPPPGDGKHRGYGLDRMRICSSSLDCIEASDL